MFTKNNGIHLTILFNYGLNFKNKSQHKIMTQNIYELFQDIIPELKQQALPEYLGNPEDLEEMNSWDLYYALGEWMNESIHIWHYIEMTEFQNHDIEDNYYLIQKNVDTHVIEQQIAQAVDQLFEQNKGNQHIDLLDETYDIFFDTLCAVAEQQQLSLLVVVKENPDWMFIPKQSDEKLAEIAELFNATFNEDEDSTMVVY